MKTYNVRVSRLFENSLKAKAIIYKKHLLLYQIQEPSTVNIVDIIDPRQYRRAKKCY